MTKAQILIVEDERIVADDLKMTLTNLGYDVIAIASTGERAIEIAGSRHPDLILMDILLAGKIDGITTAEKIHALKGNPAVTGLDLVRIGLDTRFFEISQGIPVTLNIANFTDKDKEFFRRYNFSSIAVLSIRVQDSLYCLLLFIDRFERTWSDEEFEAMKISANIIGSALGLSKAK